MTLEDLRLRQRKTEDDVEQAIADGRRRVGDEFGDLLTARALTDAEIDALDEQQRGQEA